MIELSQVQQRVVGALAEKDMTTPDNYPLSMNALIAACNQTTNREPVLALTQDAIENALANLRALGVTRVVYSKGMRVDKYKHALDEVLHLDRAALALLTVLLLRGPQTGAELRARTERMHTFAGNDDIDAALRALAARDEPLAELLPRQPGQKEQRWTHLLGKSSASAVAGPTDHEWVTSAPPPPARESAPDDTADDTADRIAALEARVAALEALTARLSGT